MKATKAMVPAPRELNITVLQVRDGYRINGIGCGYCYAPSHAMPAIFKRSTDGEFWPYKIIVAVFMPERQEWFVQFGEW